MSFDTPVDPQATPSPSPTPTSRQRRVTGAAELRALAHPLRLAIVEELSLDGPLTASQLAPRVDASPSLCSFHLRHLAAHGFVRESARPGGRARPWEVTSESLRIEPDEETREERLAGAVLERVLTDRWLARYGAWRETQADHPEEWRKAAVDDQYVYWLTPAELQELRQRIQDLIMPMHRERRGDPGSRPPGALPVELLIMGYPMRPAP